MKLSLMGKRSAIYLSVILIALLSSSCSSVEPTAYKKQTPKLEFNKFLQGKLTGWGIYQGRNGEVQKRFRIDMTANWEGDTGTFIENFTFNDGTKQVREWALTRIDDHHYTGKANDSVGVGKGEVWGNSMHWNYTIRTVTESGTYNLDYDYWMHLIDEKTLINRATLSKFGFTLGDIAVTFHKQ